MARQTLARGARSTIFLTIRSVSICNRMIAYSVWTMQPKGCMLARSFERLFGTRRRDDPLDHSVHRAALMPVPHEHDVVIGIDPDDVRSVADGREAGLRPARPLLLLRVEPPEIAVIRPVRAGRGGVVKPFRR